MALHPLKPESLADRVWGRVWPVWAVQGVGLAMMVAGLGLPWVMGWAGCVVFEETMVEVETTSGDGTTSEAPGTTGHGITGAKPDTGAATTGTSVDTGDITTGAPPPLPEKKWKAGERFAEKTAQRPALVFIPGGSFKMRSPAGEKGRDDDELRHTAKVDAFVMCNTEVTQGQYRAVLKESPSDCGSNNEGCGSGHPVQNVNWNDACAYMQKLTELENQDREVQGLPALTQCYESRSGTWAWTDRACTGYRLPTEAEWERAARAGTKTTYFFGENWKEMGVSIIMQYADCGRGLFERPSATAKKKRNPWGLYDIYGNVWEWCWDWRAPYKSATKANYAGPNDGDVRVLRGGDFTSGVGQSYSSIRSGYAPSLRYFTFGFRCVRAPQPS